MQFLKKFPKLLLVLLIRGYQKTVSPDHSWRAHFYPHGYCRFYPSCSEYSVRAIEKYGCIRGSIQTLWRIIRCNPFSRGGIDDV